MIGDNRAEKAEVKTRTGDKQRYFQVTSIAKSGVMTGLCPIAMSEGVAKMRKPSFNVLSRYRVLEPITVSARCYPRIVAMERLEVARTAVSDIREYRGQTGDHDKLRRRFPPDGSGEPSVNPEGPGTERVARPRHTTGASLLWAEPRMRETRLRWWAALLAGLIAIGAGGSAQTNTGEIGSVVVDTSGAVLPGATVVAIHPASGFTIERVTDAEGRVFLPALPTGVWEVTAALPGFRRATQTGITLELGRTLQLELTLSLGAITEEVTVEITVPLLQVTTAEISDVIETRKVEEMPLNGRQFLQLAQLSDAVVIPPGGTRGGALQQAGPLPNVGEQRAGHNIYMLDGFKVTDELFNNLVINPSIDSIQEFKIQKSMYPPEFGGKASALINVATKAGGNRFHGSLFEFVRDDRFDAHNFFDDRREPVPPLEQHQFGGSLGGRLVRDRTFFFVSYERQRTRRSITKTFSVPNAALRAGDFSGFGPICDPGTINPATGTCTPFSNSQIPADRLDTIATTFLAHVPLPNSESRFQNLTSVEPQDKSAHLFSIRVDHRLSNTDQLFIRFSSFDATEIQPFGTSVLQETLVPGFGRTLDTTTRNLGVSHTRTFGTSMLNELRFG